MKYSEVSRLLEAWQDEYREFSVMLVDLDRVEGDDIEVVLSPPGKLEVDAEKRQIRLYSAAVRPYEDLQPSLFGVFASRWPLPGVLDGDFDVLVQLPIAPEEVPGPSTLVPLAGVRMAPESQEVWLLVHPEAEYPADVLPN